MLEVRHENGSCSVFANNCDQLLEQGPANLLSIGPKNEMILLGEPQLLSQKKHSERFNIEIKVVGQ